MQYLAFRHWHLHQILSDFDPYRGPLDAYLRRYFQVNRSLGSKDRRWICDCVYAIWRNLITLCAILQIPHCPTREQWLHIIDFWIDNAHSLQQKRKELPPWQALSFPKELFAQLQDSYGGLKAEEICKNQLDAAPTDIRANPIKTSRPKLLKQIPHDWNARAVEMLPHAIRVNTHKALSTHQLYKEGFFEIQDAGSQWLAEQLPVSAGNRICDFCAGAGGKTLAFAHKLKGKGQIFLHDIRTSALEQAKLRLKRAGIQNAQIILNEKLMSDDFADFFDLIFMDAPCSGSGTLRRNPDLKARLNIDRLNELVELNFSIFQQALSRLKTHGKLLYATCSVFPMENQDFISQALHKYPIQLIKEHTLFPQAKGHDGFYMALIQKTK